MPKKPANPAGKAVKKAIKDYYEALQSYHAQGVTHEGALQTASQNLLAGAARVHHCTLIPQQPYKKIRPDGAVYTPQEIVDFMCASVEEALHKEFNLTLGSKGVNILDPCTGTGNFIVNLINRIPGKDLPRVYKEQLFANEVMLLPYYIAALNIEHAYYERTGQYEAFDGLCFADTEGVVPTA